MKVYSIGIDGLDEHILLGYLSHRSNGGFKELYDSSLRYRLKSTIPPMSPPAWSSIITGLKKSRHGIYDFYLYDKLSRRLRLSSGEDLPFTIFDIMNHSGRRQLLINIPFLYPPKRVNGVIVSGMPASYSSSIYTYPEKLGEALKRRGLYVGEPPWSSKKTWLEKSIRDRSLLFHRLSEIYTYDFSMVVFRETDVAQHYFWHDRPYIYSVYELIDRSFIKPLIDRIRDDREDAVVMIYGDHGFTSGRGTLNIMNHLYRKNLYTFRESIKNILRSKLMEIVEKTYLSRVTPYLSGYLQGYYLRGFMKYLGTGGMGYGPLMGCGSVTDGGGYLYLEPKYSSSARHIHRLLQNALCELDIVEDVHHLNRDGVYRRTHPDYIIRTVEGIVYYPYYTGGETYIDKVPHARRGTHAVDTVLLYAVFRDGEPYTMQMKLDDNLYMEDIASIMLYSNGIKPPSFLDGRVPYEVSEYLRDEDTRVAALSLRERLRLKAKLSSLN
jgi:hypothetical protein